MLDKLRDQLAAFLSQHHTGVLSTLTASSVGAWAIPVHYQANGLQVECLVPRWSEVAYYLEQNCEIILVVMNANAGLSQQWLSYQGQANLTDTPTFSDGASLVPYSDGTSKYYYRVLLQPQRLDLIDESGGWGRRETFEVARPD